MEGKSFIDPIGRENRFFARNFVHLVKLEFYNAKERRWVEAKASVAIPQLKAGILDEGKYRIVDKQRPRTWFWTPGIIRNPDEIHENITNSGTEIYSRRYDRKGESVKIVLVANTGASTRTVVTSFWCTDEYHRRCILLPAKHPAPK